MDRFISALIVFANEDPANLAAIKTLRNDAFARIQEGGGEISTEVAGTMSGQNYTFEVKRAADELFADLTEVITAVEGGGVSDGRSTSFDFSCFRNH